MASLERYLYERRRLREATAWLTANDESLVATAMYHLNRMAAGMGYCTPRERIYELKNHLVRVFYERGYCERVTRQRQVFECWNCNGTGHDDYDDWTEGGACTRCNGTGIYREHVLYCFVFNVNSKRFVWHQPANLVKWEVDAEYIDAPYKQLSGRWQPLTSEMATAYEALVYVYLKRAGVTPDLKVARLRDVFSYYAAQFKYTRVGRPLYNHYTNLKYRLNPSMLDEIPF